MICISANIANDGPAYLLQPLLGTFQGKDNFGPRSIKRTQTSGTIPILVCLL